MVVLLSGGMDSATLLGLYHEDYRLYPISFRYGQKHTKELTYAKALSEHYNLHHTFIDISFMKDIAVSAQTNDYVDIPEGRYDEKSMKVTVTPNRNMILLSIAAAYSITLGARRIAYAAHAGDHTIYPDCRPEFIRSMSQAFTVCDFEPITFFVPFNGLSKAQVLRLGQANNVPYKLTWSCYKGGDRACGKCGTCFERLEAFAEVGIEDPIEYEDREWWKTYKKEN